jgi:hypothetical protein
VEVLPGGRVRLQEGTERWWVILNR